MLLWIVRQPSDVPVLPLDTENGPPLDTENGPLTACVSAHRNGLEPMWLYRLLVRKYEAADGVIVASRELVYSAL